MTTEPAAPSAGSAPRRGGCRRWALRGLGCTGLLVALVAAVLIVLTAEEGKSPPWLVHVRRVALVELVDTVMLHDTLDKYFGPICRWAVPVGDGWVAATGLSIAYLEPGESGRLDLAYKFSLGMSPHGGVSHETHVYVAAGDKGLVTLDASDPSDITIADTAYEDGYALGVEKAHGHLYLVHKEDGGVAVFRIRYPDPPELVDRLLEGQNFGNLTVDGDRAYVVGEEKLVVLDLTDPSHPRVRSELPLPYDATPKPTDPMPRRVAVRHPYAFLAHGALGLHTVDVSDPDAPRYVERWEDIEFCDWVMAYGDALYFASEGTPVTVADVSDPLEPRVVGTLFDLEEARRDQLSVIRPGPSKGPLVPIVPGPRGVFLMDMEDPLHPRPAQVFTFPPYFHDLHVEGETLYAATAAGGLRTYSLADPARPRHLGTYDTVGIARDIAVTGDRLWLSDVLGWMAVFELGEGPLPRFLGVTDRMGHAWDAHMEGERAYVSNSLVGLAVFDRRRDHLDLFGEARSHDYSIEIAGKGPYAYVGTIGSGVTVYRADVSPPELQTALKWPSVGPLPFGIVATAVVVDGDTLYVGTGRGELRAYDLADPAHPELRWAEPMGGSVYDAVPEDDGLWVSAGEAGLYRLAVGPEGAEVLGHLEVEGDVMTSLRYRDRVLVAAGEGGLLSLEAP